MSIAHEGGAEMSVQLLQVAGGSIPGRGHVLAGRNNQDAYGWQAEGDRFAAVVTDGCSSGAHSELGARLGAELWLAMAQHTAPGEGFCDRIVDGMLAELARLNDTLGGGRVEDALLFTLIGFVAVGDEAWLCSAGDGVVALNGTLRVLGPFPDNAPPYLGYRLLGARIPLTVERIALPALRTLVLATDGATEVPDLARFPDDDRLVTNRDGVRRRLAVLAREGVRLDDDTTVVAIRRRSGG